MLEAARALFRESGLEAGMAEVAERAGVGVGTVYRHFPSKAELVDAVFEDIVRTVLQLAREALEDPEPWAGFETFVHGVAEESAANCGFRTVMRSRLRESEGLSAIWAETLGVLEHVIDRAQADGSMREDVGVADVRALFWAMNGVADTAAEGAPELWRRHVHLGLDGLRRVAATPMPVPGVGRRRARSL